MPASATAMSTSLVARSGRAPRTPDQDGPGCGTGDEDPDAVQAVLQVDLAGVGIDVVNPWT